ncbi:DUF4913 domain-containing protein [Pseudonocardia alaniniphila]|uniref:DUF4913 domain-containing protein n=1 Tax=Pseudonocardia alaniniphila TaxID=75291 RepID=A0ABS9T9W2_9PSEU|nr:DUF4913 domain-containing protein [Pseudonocardia alaniniphila]MCH6165208.1 DUF4913 domain-containing protein [Pseudonocardia alaniniphila]
MTTPDDRLIAELCARVQALEAWRTHQSDQLDELLNSIPTAEPVDMTLAEDDEQLDTDALIDWVHDTVTSVIARPLRGELTWCPLWWEHPEAVFRLEALRRAWTELAPEPGTAMSIWIRDHLDPCLRELLTPLGPFADCTHNERYRALNGHTPLPTLPTKTPEQTD